VTRKDPLRLLEAAYAFDRDEPAWMRGVVEAARPYDLGSGVAMQIAQLGPKLFLRTAISERLACDFSAVSKFMRSGAAPPWAGRMYAPGPAAFVLDAVAAAGIPPREFLKAAKGWPLGWGVRGGDPDVESALLFMACERRDALAPADRHVLDAVGAHLGACLRLRRAMRGAAPTSDGASTEAVLSPSGKVLDARGARAQRSLSALVDAARRTERARSRRPDAEERLALWTALFEGRWSVVETVERDGKRMLLACRNEPETAPLRELTTLERAIAQYVALGHPYKYVAYELGISVSGVAAQLQRALRKLGLRCRADLIRLLGGPRPAPEAPTVTV